MAKNPDKLQYVIDKLTPALFYAGDGKGFLRQLKACGALLKRWLPEAPRYAYI